MKPWKYYPSTSGRNEWMCWQMDDGKFLMATPFFRSRDEGGFIRYNIIKSSPTWFFPRGIPKDFSNHQSSWKDQDWIRTVVSQGRIDFSRNLEWLDFLQNPEVFVMVSINA
jgi:hypothetical protein